MKEILKEVKKDNK